MESQNAPGESTGRRFPFVLPDDDAPSRRAIETFISSPEQEVGRAGAAGPDREETAVGSSPDALIDPMTGLESSIAWERRMRDEAARWARYRRPVAIVVAELDGLARLGDRFGPEPAARLIPAVGDAMRRLARASDVVAHLGDGRFQVLMPETDEIQAINYVERVRAACDRWLEAGAVSLRLVVGWSSPSAGAPLESAVRTAEERLNADRRRPAVREGA